MLAVFCLLAAVDVSSSAAVSAVNVVSPVADVAPRAIGIVPSSSADDFTFSDGAGGSGGPKDKLCDGANIRTGNPGSVSRVTLDHPLLAPGYEISSLSMHFRYSAGYTPSPGHPVLAPNVSVVLTDAVGKTLAHAYSSPALGNFSFDHFKTYSPPLPVNATGLHIPNTKLIFVVMMVHNNARNLQIPIDDLATGWDVTVGWTKV